jgi:hypothetical protein
MRKLIVSTFLTLDGVMRAPGGPEEDKSGVDEYRLWVFPVVIGSGKRLFSDGTVPSALKLVDSKVSSTGVVIGTYEPAGEIVTGSFALE